MYKHIDVLGYKVFCGTLLALDLNKKHLINTFSPNSYGIALYDKKFEIALKNTDVLVLDGIGIAIGSIILHGKNIKKIAGQDCFNHFMAEANTNHRKVFFLGSSDATIQKIINRIHIECQNIEVSGYSLPFKQIFSEQDNELTISIVNSFQPDILFIGMTAPKQEKWAYENRNRLNARIICTIGNVFDWYAGNSRRPGKIWIRLRLEWLIRIFLRPEIFKRNTKNQLMYLRDLLFHISFIKRTNKQ